MYSETQTIKFRVHLNVKTCEISLCCKASVFLFCIVLKFFVVLVFFCFTSLVSFIIFFTAENPNFHQKWKIVCPSNFANDAVSLAIVRPIIRLCINGCKQTDHPSRRAIWIVRQWRRIIQITCLDRWSVSQIRFSEKNKKQKALGELEFRFPSAEENWKTKIESLMLLLIEFIKPDFGWRSNSIFTAPKKNKNTFEFHFSHAINNRLALRYTEFLLPLCYGNWVLFISC